MSRESRNAILIENWRVSRVPIDPTETIYAGDMMVWDAGNARATKATAASAGTFMGVSDHANPVPTSGILTQNQQLSITNIVQSGLVEMEAGEELANCKPFEIVTVGADAQTVVKTGATNNNKVGFLDTTCNGKTYAIGDRVPIWLVVSALYSTDAGAR